MKLNVRIHPKAQAEKFRRCGMAFSRDWQTVEVDEFTGNRLMAEQMLEVGKPEDGAAKANPAADVFTAAGDAVDAPEPFGGEAAPLRTQKQPAKKPASRSAAAREADAPLGSSERM